MNALRLDESLLRGVIVHTGLYHIYTILFGLSVYIHLKKQTRGLYIHLTFLGIPFILSSIAYVSTIYQVVKLTSGENPPWPFEEGPDQMYSDLTLLPIMYMVQQRRVTLVVRICYILSNLMADLYITYRCYIVWSGDRKIIVLPLLLIITTFVLQIGFKGVDPLAAFTASTIFTFVTNLSLTTLIAGRIWWVGCKASMLLPPKVLGSYRRTIQILLESGLLYPATQLALVITVLTHGKGMNWDGLVAANLCIVNIAPTLIMIRVGLGVSVDNVETVKACNEGKQPVNSEESWSLPCDTDQGSSKV